MNMKFFDFNHLPKDLREVSKEVFNLAHTMNMILPDCEEKEVGMRKLLEAKDCFVRAQLERLGRIK